MWGGVVSVKVGGITLGLECEGVVLSCCIEGSWGGIVSASVKVEELHWD